MHGGVSCADSYLCYLYVIVLLPFFSQVYKRNKTELTLLPAAIGGHLDGFSIFLRQAGI